MPPWTRLLPEKSDQKERELRRRTFIDPNPTTQSAEEFSAIDYGATVRGPSPIRSGARRGVRNSIASFSAVTDGNHSLYGHSNGGPDSLQAEDIEQELKPPRPNRSSMLGFRHASDSHLSRTARLHAEAAPPIPFNPPSIITTAPTFNESEAQKRRSHFIFPRKIKFNQTSEDLPRPGSQQQSPEQERSPVNANGEAVGNAPGTGRVTFDESSRLRNTITAPPAYGDVASSTLALPATARLSESSKSDGSSGEHGIFATTTTTHTVHTTTTFFRLPRRKKDKGPLFPLPPKTTSSTPTSCSTPRASNVGRSSVSPTRQSFHPLDSSGTLDSPRPSGQHSPVRPRMLRSNSKSSARSGNGMPFPYDPRTRSSTFGSLRHPAENGEQGNNSHSQSTRTSTSTAGRPSLGGLFSLSRLRQNNDPLSRSGTQLAMPGTPGSVISKQDSFYRPREPAVVIPERQEGDTPAKYLARLEEVLNRSALVTFLSKSDDEFIKNVMRSYMRRFKFFEYPLDMAIRKLLMHVELPKETQQIDRTLQSFADRYFECNPGIFSSVDETYFIAFSVLILHTDVFNKNNKHKMTKEQYIKNARGQGISPEILECFYDNTAYTPFIHVDDDIDVTGEQLVLTKHTRKVKPPANGSTRKSSGPVDPYTLILEQRLDVLRPDELGQILIEQDPFQYLGPAESINFAETQRAFFRYGVIQILSSRSRPDAFANAATITNPSEAPVGIVDIRVTKVGILWRKDPKKKKTRSPWQDWGAILTGSQLYFFRNTSWVKGLMHQFEQHQRHGRATVPVVFKPPLEQFNPDFMLSTEDVVALVDSQYKKHKNSFVFTRQNTFQETLLADNEYELNDWLAKINFAATYRTTGIRMRTLMSNSADLQSHRALLSDSSSALKVPVDSSMERLNTTLSTQDASLRDILMARKQIMTQRVEEFNTQVDRFDKQIDALNRTSRQLKVLAPIQNRTRDDVVGAAIILASRIRWAQIDAWRIKCYRDILTVDLKEDLAIQPPTENADATQLQAKVTSPTPSNASAARLALSRLSSKSSSTAGQSNRPSLLGSGTKLFSMDEVFRTPSKLKSNHRPKSSWELPPLDFTRRRSESAHRNPSSQADESSVNGEAQPQPLSVEDNTEPVPEIEPSEGSLRERPIVSTVVSSINTPATQPAQDEHEMLVEAGLISPETQLSEGTSKAPSTGVTEGEEKLRIQDGEAGDSLSKVRHSIHRKLHQAHVPHHVRSKKGKDSGSSLAITEDSNSTGDSEVLVRGTGSFTVHGKKASVITFGSEWQNMSPEERIRIRKQAFEEENKGSETDGAAAETTSLTRSVSGPRPQTPEQQHWDATRPAGTPDRRPFTPASTSTITSLEKSDDRSPSKSPLDDFAAAPEEAAPA